MPRPTDCKTHTPMFTVVGLPDQKAQVSWGISDHKAPHFEPIYGRPLNTFTLSTQSPILGHTVCRTQNAIFKQFSICLSKCNLIAEWSVQLMHCFMLVLVIWCGDTYWHLLWIRSVPARKPPILVFYWSNLVSLFIVLLCGGWGPSEDCWRHQWDRKTRGRVTIVGSRCQKEISSILLLFLCLRIV